MNKPKSFYAEYWSTDGKTLIGGVRRSKSSRFQRKEDAETRLESVKEMNGLRCDGKVVPSARYPEIFIHCGSGPAQAIGGHCFGCRKLLTAADAKEAS